MGILRYFDRGLYIFYYVFSGVIQTLRDWNSGSLLATFAKNSTVIRGWF